MIGEFAHGPGLFVPSRVALILWRSLDLDSVRSDVNVRGADPELDRLLASWSEVAAHEAWARAGSVLGTSLGESVPRNGLCDVMGTKAVADLAGLTDRAVRKAVDRGSLPAMRVGHAWSFAAADVAVWLARRAA